MKKISRRRMLKAIASLAGAVGLGQLSGLLPEPGSAQEMDEHVYLPVILKSDGVSPPPPPPPPPPPADGKVVHVHSNNATFWDFGNDYYGDFVDQATVNEMVDRGVMELTSASSVALAWQALVPNYSPGKAIAVKVNFNNCRWCDMCRTDCPDEWGLVIDALIHPVNAIVRGLLQAYPNFETSDIWIYDATVGKNPPVSHRHIPGRFKDGSLYPDLRFFDQGCNEIAGYLSAEPSAIITWQNPPGIATPPAMQVSDVLVNAAYLINIPVMKSHLSAGVTLSFKNHYGSIATPNLMHDWTFIGWAHFGGTSYSPLLDIYRNPHILGKTILTIGDGLFGNFKDNIGKPSPWTTFGNTAPNCLFFAIDPVAIDCAMCDFLNAEKAIRNSSDDYLVCADGLGLGTYERGDPWGGGYNKIDYLKIDV